jgi:pilus assembly protein Flp/PilA
LVVRGKRALLWASNETKALNMLAGYLRASLALRLDRRAVTAIEYSLIVALIAIVIVTSVTSVGAKLPAIFNKISTVL